jgi:hypothetical protein
MGIKEKIIAHHFTLIFTRDEKFAGVHKPALETLKSGLAMIPPTRCGTTANSVGLGPAGKSSLAPE